MEKDHCRILYDNSIFKKNFKYLINKYKITQKELEIKLDMSEGLFSRYLNNKKVTEPKIGILNSVAKYFNITIDDLINKDLQSLEYMFSSENNNSEVLFLKKIIKDTLDGYISWEILDFKNHHYIISDSYSSNWLKTIDSFESRFTGKIYSLDELRAYTCLINLDDNTDIQLVIINFIDDNLNFMYEFYMINSNNKVIPACCSYDFWDNSNNEFYILLEKLYKIAPVSEKESIYVSYLNKSNY